MISKSPLCSASPNLIKFDKVIQSRSDRLILTIKLTAFWSSRQLPSRTRDPSAKKNVGIIEIDKVGIPFKLEVILVSKKSLNPIVKQIHWIVTGATGGSSWKRDNNARLLEKPLPWRTTELNTSLHCGQHSPRPQKRWSAFRSFPPRSSNQLSWPKLGASRIAIRV